LIGAAGLVWASAAVAEEAAQKSVKSASIAKPAVVRKTSVPLVETGVASVYCFRNGPTASGERSRPAVLTAAHKTLPFGTLVEVTNRQNGRSVVVRINDRGPFVEGRIIDLTPAAARALKFDGLANVTVRVLDHQRDLRIVARAI
jgi:rare lipoprotein A